MENMIALALAITSFAIVIYFAVRADARLNKSHPSNSEGAGFTPLDVFGDNTESIHSADDEDIVRHGNVLSDPEYSCVIGNIYHTDD